MEKRLARSKKDKMITGVAGGLAEYFKIDSTVMRFIIAAVFIAQPVFIIAYIAGAFIIPVNKRQFDADDVIEVDNGNRQNYNVENTKLIAGGVLVFIGASILSKKLIPWHSIYFWPVILVAAGALIIYKGRRNNNEE